MSIDPGVLIPAVMTLIVFSILYKDNPLFHAAERLGVGMAAGYALILILRTGIIPRFSGAVHHPADPGNILLFIPIVLGIGFIFSAVGRPKTLSRYAIASAAAIGAGFAIPYMTQTLVLAQMKATMVPVGLSTKAGFDALVIAFCVLTGMSYFSFSKEPKGIRALISDMGLYTLMIAFGTTFGHFAMSRITLLINRFLFLIRDFLHIIT